MRPRLLLIIKIKEERFKYIAKGKNRLQGVIKGRDRFQGVI